MDKTLQIIFNSTRNVFKKVKISRSPIGFIQIAAIAIISVLALYYSQAPSEEEVLKSSGLKVAKPLSSKAVYVSIVKVKAQDNLIEVRGTGSIVVRNLIDLVPQVSGRIIWVAESFKRGGSFFANERLLQIDPKDFELAVAQTAADRLSAESNYQLAKAQSDAAIANYAILNPGADVPPLVAKTPQLEQAKAQIAAASAREQIAQLNLERTNYSLPFSGRVVDSQAEVGQLLNQGQKFGEAFDIESIEALVPISPSDLAILEPAVGRKAKVNLGEVVLSATVARVSPNLDERTRFAQLYLSLQNQTNLYPGSFIDVVIEGPRLRDTVLLPEAAEQINESVWTMSGGKLKKAQPKFINRKVSGVIVENFVTGDGVVLGTVPGAKEGMAVTTEPD